jgi:hypothetical protein
LPELIRRGIRPEQRGTTIEPNKTIVVIGAIASGHVQQEIGTNPEKGIARRSLLERLTIYKRIGARGEQLHSESK